jgi:hypothetical protein
LSAGKLLATVFWGRKGVLMVELMQHSNVRSVLQNTKKLLSSIQNKRHGMLTFGKVLLHDNACLHAAACTRALLEHFSWELFDHPP